MDFGNTTTSIWSKIKSYIDNKLSATGGGVKRIINIDFISTGEPQGLYNDYRFKWWQLYEQGFKHIYCSVYNKQIYYGLNVGTSNENSTSYKQYITDVFSDYAWQHLDPNHDFYHGVVDNNTILNLHGTFYNADLQQCDSKGNILT